MKRRPTLGDLRRQAEAALREPGGIDLGPLSHSERNKLLFGTDTPCECAKCAAEVRK